MSIGYVIAIWGFGTCMGSPWLTKIWTVQIQAGSIWSATIKTLMTCNFAPKDILVFWCLVQNLHMLNYNILWYPQKKYLWLNSWRHLEEEKKLAFEYYVWYGMSKKPIAYFSAFLSTIPRVVVHICRRREKSFWNVLLG